jgi:IS605 OrfB family transposase
MKLMAQVKLQPTKEQARFLRQTLEQANAACDAISEIAWENETFGQYKLHKLTYAMIRENYKLSAQVVVRCIAKVADAYKLDKKTPRRFKKHGAIAFDDRILTWRTEKQFVTIWTIGGRQKISYVCGARQQRLLESRLGESDLIYHNGEFFLLAVCEVVEPTPDEVADVLGVDFGIVQMAVDSDGHSYNGEQIEAKRQWYQERRQILQKVGTKSAQRKLKKMRGRQRRYQRNENHRISKEMVSKAKDTNRLIAVEELTHIRARTTVRKSQRARQSNWAFRQLRDFLTYKAPVLGVTIVAVDPRHTSQRCSHCGHIERANRKSQSEFVCCHCGFSANADFNAALNIRAKGLVNVPLVSVSHPLPREKQAAHFRER